MPDQNVSSTSANPQLLRLEQKKQAKRKESKKKSNEQTIKSDESTATAQKKIELSQALMDIEVDIRKKNILSNLSREQITYDEVSDKRLESARGLHTKQIQSDPKQDRIEKFDVISYQLKELTKRFGKRKLEIAEWKKKYKDRMIRMSKDVKEYERKIKKRLNQEHDRIAALLLIAERNKLKRIWIGSNITKAMTEHPKQIIVKTIIEFGFNFVQNILWTLALARDFFTIQR